MPSDWIKMRTDLYRDPKVCLMADFLMDKDGELGRYINQNLQRDMAVTRNVMRNATVGALVTVWGVLRHRGKRKNDDLVIKGCSLAVIDDIAEIQGFGDAMESVGWVENCKEGILMPRFFEDFNIEPDQEAAQKNRERQRRFRERQKEKIEEQHKQISNVTVTLKSNAREEKRRVNNISTVVEILVARSVRAGVARDFATLRSKKRAPLTDTAIKGLEREAAKAGISLDAALDICCQRGWQGFKAEWINDAGVNKSVSDKRKEAFDILTGAKRKETDYAIVGEYERLTG